MRKSQLELKGKTVLVTAGPTQEPLDPIRFISNRSSGKMGYAVALAALKFGAKVILISGPTHLSSPQGVNLVRIVTARELREAVLKHFPKADVVVAAAAVADYRPESKAARKIRKEGRRELTIRLVRNPDILRELGKTKGDKILVGFAAETGQMITNAREKLKKKNLDLIVANDVTKKGSGFEVDTNIVSIISRDGKIISLPKLSKTRVAERILREAVKIIKNTERTT
ncbi:MAG: bifunctional phosphopantothenoylcysteine decarboxylase/phosphopantothenate--cysteine ligase CoaBC [Deltaproteobacteria bacterium]|nr:MAG: bifunctional phosphopantothenoylcysteine decarboxylase/phosphopantothenate--cysteine ligase CoaBC [Deltaproteobacteria bacterium]